MWFKNLLIYRLTQDLPFDAQVLETALATKPARSCSSQELATYGFVAPFGKGEDAPLVHVSQDFLLIAARKEERILPGSVVRDALKEKVDEIEAEQIALGHPARVRALPQRRVRVAERNQAPRQYEHRLRVGVLPVDRERGVIGATVDLMKSKGADPANIVATLGPRICGDCYEVGDEIADQFIKRFPLTKTKTRFGGAGIDIAEAAMIDLAFAGVHQVVDSMPRVHAATQYLEEDPELAELCRTDGEGPAELAERIDNISHSMCTLENPLWYSHRRAALANKTHEGRLLALIVRD